MSKLTKVRKSKGEYMINNVSFKGWGFGLGGFSECKETKEKKTDPYERLLDSPSDIFWPYNETRADEYYLEDISEKEEIRLK